MLRGFYLRTAVFLLGSFLLLQLIPYGHNHTNPPVVAEPAWDSPRTRALVKRACFDCHSNETAWPWYSYIAPASWLVQQDVDEGREAMNFSDWVNHPRELDEMVDLVLVDHMPPPDYRLVHIAPELSPAMKQEIISGLQNTLTP